MKYALRSRFDSEIFFNKTLVRGVETAELFSTISCGYWTVQESTPHSVGVFEPVAVEEIPGETKREVVELGGVVDHTGLKYEIRDKSDDVVSINRQRSWDSLSSTLWAALALDQIVFFSHYRIVGIRETTSPPRRVVRELVPSGKPVEGVDYIFVPHDVKIAARAFKPGDILEMT